MNQLPILYSFRRCPYAMRARLALQAAQIQVELREILLRDKAPEFVKASPKATVPVLIEPDGTILEESLDIMIWSLEHNDPESWLSPEQGTREEMLNLIGRCEDEFKSHLDRYKYTNRYKDAETEKERAKASVFVNELEQKLNGQPFLFGSRKTLADMAIVTFIRQFANTDREWFDQQPWTKVIAWLNNFLESEEFSGMMLKYDIWKNGDEPIYFGRS